MWRKLRKQIAVERELLNELVREFRVLFQKCANTPPDHTELLAAAATLHSFYNGVENVMKRVAVELHEGMPAGEAWHRSLLEQMTRPGPDRPAFISPALAKTLERYLDFRHFFRYAYPATLDWDRMKDLARDCSDTLVRLEAEWVAFLEATKDRE